MKEVIKLDNESLENSTILCVIDFSEASRNAVMQSIHLAEVHHCRLTIMYPYRLTQLNQRGQSPVQLKKSIDQDALHNFTRMTGELLKKSSISYEFRSEVGFVNDRVYAYSQQNKTGLVVISNTMVAANEDAFVGLLEQIQIPMLIIPQRQLPVL